MKNKWYRCVFFIPLLLSILLSLCPVLFQFESLKLTMDANFHFSIITINSIFAGFLYTNYSLLLGLSDSELIKRLKSSSLIEKRNRHILSGILSAVISVIVGLIIVVLELDLKVVAQKRINDFFVEAELLYMALAILFFLLSIKEIHVLIRTVNESQNKKSKEELEEIKKNMQREHKK